MEKPHSPTLNPRRGGAHKSHARLLSLRPAEDRSRPFFVDDLKDLDRRTR